MKRQDQILPENLWHQRTGGSREEVSKNRGLRKGTETTEREGLDSRAWTEGQAVWRAGKAEKLNQGRRTQGQWRGGWIEAEGMGLRQRED